MKQKTKQKNQQIGRKEKQQIECPNIKKMQDFDRNEFPYIC